FLPALQERRAWKQGKLELKRSRKRKLKRRSGMSCSRLLSVSQKYQLIQWRTGIKRGWKRLWSQRMSMARTDQPKLFANSSWMQLKRIKLTECSSYFHGMFTWNF
ncbi:hypothetical protein UlMin_004561, partial [Ulmus minor]